MPYMLVRHDVEDFAKWRPIFDAHAPARQQAGFKSGQLFRSAGDRNEVVLLFEVEDLQRARQFAQSDDLRETMQRAGVVGRPDIHFFEDGERLPG